MDKKKLRYQVLTMRNALSDEDVDRMSRSIVKKLEDFPAYASAELIMVYMDYKREVMTTPLVEKALEKGKRIVLPLTIPDEHRLSLIEIKDLKSDIMAGFKGIREPVYDINRSVAAQELDLVVVPGVVFDARGYRIGYGGGYYDRLLKDVNACKVGLAFEMQIHPVAEERHDVKMDYVITEKRIINCSI